MIPDELGPDPMTATTADLAGSVKTCSSHGDADVMGRLTTLHRRAFGNIRGSSLASSL